MNKSKYEELKLKMDLKSVLYHGSGVRKNISQKFWRNRANILEINNNTCTICGYQPPIE